MWAAAFFVEGVIGSSNNAAQQNQAAQQQIHQNTAEALAALQKYIAGNPFPVNGITPPRAPQQFTGTQGGGQPNIQTPPPMAPQAPPTAGGQMRQTMGTAAPPMTPRAMPPAAQQAAPDPQGLIKLLMSQRRPM